MSRFGSKEPGIRDNRMLGDLFEVDTLASYLYTQRRKVTNTQPVATLMWAVLQDAIDVVDHISPNKTAVRRSDVSAAREWFKSYAKLFIFDFEVLCETLDLDPAMVRKYVQHIDPMSNYSLRGADGKIRH